MLTIDTNVWVAGTLEEEPSHDVSRRFLKWVQEREPILHLPTLLVAELAGAIIRRTGDPLLAGKSRTMLERMPRSHFHELSFDAATQSASLAVQLRLRGPDAVYAATAFATNSVLITMDKELMQRASTVISAMSPAEWLDANSNQSE